jgi:hypothetical protein
MLVAGADGCPGGWSSSASTFIHLQRRLMLLKTFNRFCGVAPLTWRLSGSTSPLACSIAHNPVTSQFVSFSVFVAVAYSPLQVEWRCTPGTTVRRAP